MLTSANLTGLRRRCRSLHRPHPPAEPQALTEGPPPGMSQGKWGLWEVGSRPPTGPPPSSRPLGRAPRQGEPSPGQPLSASPLPSPFPSSSLPRTGLRLVPSIAWQPSGRSQAERSRTDAARRGGDSSVCSHELRPATSRCAQVAHAREARMVVLCREKHVKQTRRARASTGLVRALLSAV